MEPLQVSEIRVADRYESERDGARRDQVAATQHRRVILDDRIVLVFENRDTVRATVEELARAENLRDPEALGAELQGFNQLLPGDGELSACLYLEASDAAELAAAAAQLAGVERAIALEVAGVETLAEPLESSTENGLTVIAHLRFRLTQEQRDGWCSGRPVTVVVEHEACRTRVDLGQEQRAAIGRDL